MKTFFSIVGVMLLATACVTGEVTDPFGGVVVERSKEQPPAWAELAPGQLHEAPDLLKYVEVQTQHADLPFGIKRTQTDALEASKLALKDRTRALLLQIATTNHVFTTEPPTEFDELLLEVTDEVHREHAKVADIYFEKLQVEEPVGSQQLTEYYRAQVLIHFPRARLDELMQSVASRLERSRLPELQSLGRAAMGVASAEITH